MCKLHPRTVCCTSCLSIAASPAVCSRITHLALPCIPVMRSRTCRDSRHPGYASCICYNTHAGSANCGQCSGCVKCSSGTHRQLQALNAGLPVHGGGGRWHHHSLQQGHASPQQHLYCGSWEARQQQCKCATGGYAAFRSPGSNTGESTVLAARVCITKYNTLPSTGLGCTTMVRFEHKMFASCVAMPLLSCHHSSNLCPH